VRAGEESGRAVAFEKERDADFAGGAGVLDAAEGEFGGGEAADEGAPLVEDSEGGGDAGGFEREGVPGDFDAVLLAGDVEGGQGSWFADGLGEGRRVRSLGAGGVPEAPTGGEEDDGGDDGETGEDPSAGERPGFADETGGGRSGGFAGAGEVWGGREAEASGNACGRGLSAAGDEIEAEVGVAELLGGDCHEEGGLFGKDAAVELLFFGAEAQFAAGVGSEPAEDAAGAAAGESFDLAGEGGEIAGGEEEGGAAGVVAADGAPALEVIFAGDSGGASDKDAAGLDTAAAGAVHGHDNLGADLLENPWGIVQDEGAIVAAPGFEVGRAHPTKISIACESAQD
jgi:hypothetical protein